VRQLGGNREADDQAGRVHQQRFGFGFHPLGDTDMSQLDWKAEYADMAVRVCRPW